MVYTIMDFSTFSHEFHKSCIDPWLYEKGTCPMCKLNIVGDQEEVGTVFIHIHEWFV